MSKSVRGENLTAESLIKEYGLKKSESNVQGEPIQSAVSKKQEPITAKSIINEYGLKKKDGGIESSNTQSDATTPTSTELKPSQSNLPKEVKPAIPQKLDIANKHKLLKVG